MGGFVGFFSSNAAKEKKEILAPMLKRIAHRGPKASGMYADEDIALGANSMYTSKDEKNSAQPLYSKSKNLVLVFDGEIYNCADLCAALEKENYSFTKRDAAEVILNGYEAWGSKLFTKLRGVFAFCIWNKSEKTLLCVRDYFGAKPFYYGRLKTGELIFGSEIKSFLLHPNFEKEFNENALRPYLSFQYTVGAETFFKGVRSLPHGHYFVYESGEVNPKCYYEANFEPDNDLGFNACVDEINEAVKKSVELHRGNYQQVGAFLSGGVDSSYITTLLKPKETFTVGFEQSTDDKNESEKFDETLIAHEFSESLGIENHTKMLTANECFAALPDIMYYMDIPQSNPSCVPLWFLAKTAKQHTDIVFSGEGADELFGGYELYTNTPAMLKFKKAPRSLRRGLGALAKSTPAFKGRNFLLKCSEKPRNWFIGQAYIFSPKQAIKVLKPKYQSGPSPKQITAPYFNKVAHLSELNQKQYLDMNLWMPGDILVKADRMSMAHSLTVRTPLLDIEIMKLAEKIPPRYNVVSTKSKLAFRTAAGKVLPSEWAKRAKKGFPVPIRNWIRQRQWYMQIKQAFESTYAAEFFNTPALVRILDDHYNGDANNARKIWTVYTFLVWYKRYFIDDAA